MGGALQQLLVDPKSFFGLTRLADALLRAVGPTRIELRGGTHRGEFHVPGGLTLVGTGGAVIEGQLWAKPSARLRVEGVSLVSPDRPCLVVDTGATLEASNCVLRSDASNVVRRRSSPPATSKRWRPRSAPRAAS